jgi:hypothetical protein
MTDASHPLADKVDALIRRHRSFVAHSAPVPEPAPAPTLAATEPPPAQATPAHDHDIPLLTDIVEHDELAQTSAEVVVNSALTDQEKVIRAAIERWVDERLPDAILHVLDGFTDRLIAAVSERARVELLASLDHGLRSDDASMPHR